MLGPSQLARLTNRYNTKRTQKTKTKTKIYPKICIFRSRSKLMLLSLMRVIERLNIKHNCFVCGMVGGFKIEFNYCTVYAVSC